MPTSAGGGNDTMARTLTRKLGPLLGQPLVVDNRAGANGSIASEYVAAADADGHTLLFGTTSDMVVTPIANRAAGYQPQDFTPIAKVGVTQMVLLSAICVQKPLLAFQHAKLAFEKALIDSGVAYSIVRPTAFFKSLSGQVERVRQGKPFLVFADGLLTACKPIHDDDLGDFIAGCLTDTARQNRILPIGGPGEAITPRQQGEALFALLGRPPRFRRVPVALLDAIIGGLSLAGALLPSLAAKAELARIGRYYATASQLVLDPRPGRYDAAATPTTGTETLFDFYRAVLGGAAAPERGDHAVF